MYRSYRVNDMPQPIRQPYSARDNSAETNIHNDNARRSADANPPAREADAGKSPVHARQEHPPEPDGNTARDCRAPESMSPAQCPCGSPANCPLPRCPPQRDVQNAQQNKNGLLSSLKSDDFILIAVALVLLMDGCDDKLLIAALGLIFFSDYFGL